MSVARGNRFSTSVASARGSSNASPELATITGIEDDRQLALLLKGLGDGINLRPTAHHADLHRINAEIGKDRIALRAHKRPRNRMDGLDALRVLCRQRRDDAGAIDTECRESLQVCLKPGAT